MRPHVTALILATACFCGAQPKTAAATSPGSQVKPPAKATEPNDPKRAVRSFLFALYSNDVAAYQKTIIPEPGSNDLLNKDPMTPEQLKELRHDAETVELRQSTPFVADGKDFTSGNADYPVGTRTTYTTGFRGSLLAIPVVYTESGWKADVRFWVAAKKQALVEPKKSDPEIRAKAFLYFILAKRPEHLSELSASNINAQEYTAANDLPGGDLDQVLSLCLEMPVVRARTGEVYRLPSGEIVRADASADTLIMVGMMGPIEIAFQMKRIDGEWKVVPQHYFEMLRRVGAI
jgi:hypothetical protein